MVADLMRADALKGKIAPAKAGSFTCPVIYVV